MRQVIRRVQPNSQTTTLPTCNDDARFFSSSPCQNHRRPGSGRILQAMRSKCASWLVRLRWSLSRMRTTTVRTSSLLSLVRVGPNSDAVQFSSVLSPTDSRHMDRHFLHVCSLHELVAKLHIRHLELATDPASVFRSGGTCNVLRRLVCYLPATQPPLS